ncbi:Rv3654c family TadE-like protein [Spongiactinospora gelatinilytica]|uniref:Rv3654c family TadE-like protein n=1 Tax=Spongiactinospora gelatinilytica TaxID=2666298 RepID=UPI0034D28839
MAWRGLSVVGAPGIGDGRKRIRKELGVGAGGCVDGIEERGSATLWVVAFMGVLMAMAMGVAYVGMARVAVHRVRSAADLSALAAARVVVRGADQACNEAESAASANHAVLERCQVDGLIAEVRVSVRYSLPGLAERRVTSRARAGPVRRPSRPLSAGHRPL